MPGVEGCHHPHWCVTCLITLSFRVTPRRSRPLPQTSQPCTPEEGLSTPSIGLGDPQVPLLLSWLPTTDTRDSGVRAAVYGLLWLTGHVSSVLPASFLPGLKWPSARTRSSWETPARPFRHTPTVCLESLSPRQLRGFRSHVGIRRRAPRDPGSPGSVPSPCSAPQRK